MGKNKHLLDTYVRKPLKSIKSLNERYYTNRESMRLYSYYDQRSLAASAHHNKDRLSESIPVLREYINSICTQLSSSTDNYQRYDLLSNITKLLAKFNILKHLNLTLESLIISDTLKKALKDIDDDLETYKSLKIYRNECHDLANEIINFTTEYAGLEALLFSRPETGMRSEFKQSKSF